MRSGDCGLVAEWPDGVTLALGVERRTATSVRVSCTVEASRDVTVEAAGVRLVQPEATRLLVDGYQSWDWAGVRDATRPGTAWWGAVWGRPAAGATAITLDRPPRTGALRLHWDGAGSLDALCRGEPGSSQFRTGEDTSLAAPAGPGRPVRTDPLRLSVMGGRVRAGVGLPPGRGVLAHRLCGWMSWNCLGCAVRAADVLAAAERLTPRGGVVLLDDGWMERWGDWQPHARFGAELDELAAALAARDRRLGVWLAPYLIDPEARSAQSDRLLLRDEHGDPVLDRRPAAPRLVLDASLAAVQRSLSETGARLGAAGVSVLKVDFLYAAALPGARRPGWTGVRALRSGLRALVGGFRSTAPPGAAVIACGAPAPCVVGLADTCRSGGDAVINVPTAHSPEPPRPWFMHGEAVIRAQARNLAARSWLWGATLPPDVDAVTLGALGDTPAVPGDLAARWLALASRSGGPLLVSDLPGAPLEPDRVELLRSAWRRAAACPPVPERPPEPLVMAATPAGEDDFLSWPPGLPDGW